MIALLGEGTTINQIFWLLISVAAVTGLAATVMVSIMFSWTLKDIGDNAVRLLIFAFVIGASSFATGKLFLQTSQTTQASPVSVIQNWETTPLSGGRQEIRFSTSEPEHVYLEYHDPAGDVIPIFAASSVEKATEHFFVVHVPLRSYQDLFIVIGGVRFNAPDITSY